jgi:hypothetical protein
MRAGQTPVLVGQRTLTVERVLTVLVVAEAVGVAVLSMCRVVLAVTVL